MLKVWRNIREDGIYKRFVVSFLIVLVLPITLFVSIFIKNYREIYREKIIDQAQEALNVSMMDLERNMENLHAIVLYNSQLEHMQGYILKKDLRGDKVRTIINAELATHSIIEDISYYNRNVPNKIYTKSGTFSLDYFSKLRIGLENEEILLNYIDQLEGSGWITIHYDLQQETGNAPALLYVVKNSSDSWWIFAISPKKLEDIIAADHAVTILLDDAGIQLYIAGGMDREAESEDDYYVIETVSANGRFKLVRTMNKKILFQELDQWQMKFYFMVAIVLVAGSMLVLVLTSYNGHPIKELQSYYKEKLPNLPKTLNGLDVFRFAIKNMEEEVSRLEEKQKRDFLLLKLIYGRDCNTVEFKEAMTEAGMFSHAECYRVIVATFCEDWESNHTKQKWQLNMAAGPDYEFQMAEVFYDNASIFIVGMSKEADRQLNKELLRIADIMKNVGQRITFYVGSPCYEWTKIHMSYLCAVTCSKGQGQKIGEHIYIYKPVKENREKFQYPNGELNMLYDALIEVDISKVRLLTDVIVDILRKEKNNQFIYMSLYYDVLNTFYRAQVKLETNTESTFVDMDLLEIWDNPESVEMILHVREQYETYVEWVKEEKKENQLIAKVIAYIEDNSKNSELSVSTVSIYFNISISNLSHQFKAQTGRTISDYITEKKFIYACELLQDTGYSIKEISQMLGYGQTTSFIRKFKQCYGVTPAEYRSGRSNSGKEKL